MGPEGRGKSGTMLERAFMEGKQPQKGTRLMLRAGPWTQCEGNLCPLQPDNRGRLVLCQGLNQSEASLIRLVQALWECHRVVQVVGVRNSALIGGEGIVIRKKVLNFSAGYYETLRRASCKSFC